VSSASDLDLIAKSVSGDTRATNELLARHFDFVFAICRRTLKNGDDAADATQDALLSIARALPSFSGESAFKSWAYRIAFNAALRIYNERKKRQESAAYSISDAGDAIPELATPSWTNPEHFGETEELEQAIANIPDEFRIALLMRSMLGMTYEEIASQLEIPIGTVRSRIARGRVALLEELGGG
jgi:RNA polymerase sigma-70 factor (ECF subfamily)